VVEGEAFAGLEAAEHRNVDARAFAHLLERQPPLGAQFPKPPAYADIDGLLGRLCLHGKKAKTLNITARFAGNEVLLRKTAKKVTVRVK